MLKLKKINKIKSKYINRKRIRGEMDAKAKAFSQQQEEIFDKLKLIEEEYIEIDKLKVYCGTFNVNGRACDENLNPWLCLSEISESANADSSIDIYALGFQELVDLTTTNLLLSSSSIEREIAWMNSINNVLLNENNFKVRESIFFDLVF